MPPKPSNKKDGSSIIAPPIKGVVRISKRKKFIDESESEKENECSKCLKWLETQKLLEDEIVENGDKIRRLKDENIELQNACDEKDREIHTLQATCSEKNRIINTLKEEKKDILEMKEVQLEYKQFENLVLGNE